MLTKSEISVIASSFRKLEPFADDLALKFYQALFELDPSLRRLFHGDMRAQGRKLVDMLGFIVVHLEDPDTLLPAVKELGVRHAGYQVEPGHYDTVGQALLMAMQEILGTSFTDEAHAAWKKVYTFLAEVMIEASVNVG